LAKGVAIEATLGGAGGAAIVALTRRYPQRWWIPAAIGGSGAATLFGALAPVLLAPLFNRFDRLEDGETRRDVLALAAGSGTRVGEVYRVDASRRTTALNAYVTGLGPTKRVVLFDTLLAGLSRDEVRVVVAHELGHVEAKDVMRNASFGALVAPAAAFAVQRLSWRLSPQRGTPAAIPALVLAAEIVMAPVSLVATRLSRAAERAADYRSLQLSGAPQAFISLQQRLEVQNVADVEPPWWVRRVLSTHPPTLERIGAAVSYEQQRGAELSVRSESDDERAGY
jgi:STE24 endopeptidase